ncbi:tRNA dihydrouridine(16) synthase DusC [Alkalilimnicola ehrlichii]|uniref:tRNA-dihydrouridine(16) synthase n=1 Tax=Alkalilimnicola ehrlichii TaxID=351052 RepID=A0A3E0WIJ6_9GAMM|nr:tRNA-dihydrouridine synthase family protein [Alkalilimnicola ehrlichii]RFA25191.1 tRNA dihydrouridine(16) synthase DusC [Alkalilimnicola ehrlichii]RFA32269.1 tRNA dihydrouridine(16) synthase DusC [Alkalilimnicola ehrlichii]
MTGQIILAPMEGVLDPLMRDILTRVGGIDQCVAEFIRVTNTRLPESVFLRHAPELASGGQTSAGVPVTVQLLGCCPSMLALNAERAAELGAPAIDLNFGCPSKTVNRHRGGAIMLETPDEIYEIVKAVRAAVPAAIPVTAKMRLGYRNKSLALENARAIAEAGAEGLTVHARTKVEGYKPPAHWGWIARIREAVKIPVTANGEVWSREDYWRCRVESGCEDVMIGRGLIAQPNLAIEIKGRQQGNVSTGSNWCVAQEALRHYFEQLETVRPAYVQGRIKQWLHMMKPQHPEAAVLFDQVKRLQDISVLKEVLFAAPAT